MTRAHRHDVVIHAPFAGQLYVRSRNRGADGAEFQMAKLARVLARRGLKVALVVFDYEGLAEDPADGVTLVRQSVDGFRNGMRRYSLETFRALAEADGRVYIQRTAGVETGFVGAFARARRRPFVFSSSSSTDLLPRPPLDTPATGVAFRAGRRIAQELVVQTEDQARLAATGIGRQPSLIRSFCETRPPAEADREAFLWIGGIVDYKDPLAYAALAEMVPEARFWMVATSRGAISEPLEGELRAAAERLPNLELLPPRSREALVDLYQRSVAVVNTSHFEGFPNTFMEGWSCGASALSLRLDPDGVIQREGLGIVADGTLESLAEGARTLWRGRGDRDEQATAARRYIADNHEPDRIGAELETLIRRLAA